MFYKISRKIIFLLLIIFLFTSCTSKKEEKTQYHHELEDLVNGMLEDLALAESVASGYIEIWYRSINNEEILTTGWTVSYEDFAEILEITSSEVNNYAKSAGFMRSEVASYYYPQDFNEAINFLNNYFIDNGPLNEIEENQSIFTNKIKELNQPPEEYSQFYDIVIDLYKVYEKYTDLVLKPTGSYISYKEDIEKLSEEFLDKYKDFTLRYPTLDNE